MSDYIKREDAIRQIVKTSAQNELDIPAIGTVIYILSEMDSADVVEGDKAQKEVDYWHDLAQSYEQTITKLTLCQADVRENVRGEWISHDLENGEKSIDKDCCSVCGERFREIAMTGCEWNFCPNCGADMRGEQDE